MVTDDEIKRLRALCDAATPGPWYRECEIDEDVWCGTGGKCFLARPVIGCMDSDMADDAAFIIAARDAVPALLDEVAQLTGIVKRLRGENGRAPELEAQLTAQNAGLVTMAAQRDAALAEVERLRAEVERLKADKAPPGEWEKIAKPNPLMCDDATFRLRVTGGYLYRVGECMVFAPDSVEGWAGK